VAVGSSPPERAVAGTMHRVTLPSGRAVVHLQLPMPPRLTKVVTILADSIVTFTSLAQPSNLPMLMVLTATATAIADCE
jgi:hypothetical protein